MENALGYDLDEYVGRHISDFHADPAAIDDILTRLVRGERISRYPARLRAKDGSLRHVLITSSGNFIEGVFVNTRCFTVDMTTQRETEQRVQNHNQQVLDALPAAVYTTDVDGCITYFNLATVDLTGRRPELGKHHWCLEWSLYQPDGTPLSYDEWPLTIALKEQRPVRDKEAILERPDQTRASFLSFPTPLRDPQTNEVVGAVNMLVDITARNRAEESERLLTRELNHRIKNTLANVQSMARHTLRRSRSPEAFVESFSARLQALSGVHAMLTTNNWRGTELSALIRDQLLSGSFDESRLTTQGPSVTIDAEMALRLALVLHELATNAQKYGALSSPAGRITVVWRVEKGVLVLNWTEQGGPLVQAPTRKGFGSLLIEQTVRTHGGSSTLNYEASGVIWILTLPLMAPMDTKAPQTVSPAKQPVECGADRLSIRGKRVLVVEDEPLIALDLMATLEELGIEPIGPAGALAEALELICSTTFDAALVDANLSGRPVDEIAAALTRLGVPFAFVSGYGPENLPRGFQSAMLISKPSSRETLDAALYALLRVDARTSVVPLRKPAG